MLGRRHIAQEGRPAHRGNRPADSRRDVIVSRRNVRDERSQHVERRTLADRLLKLHIRRDLVHRDMARSLDHNLNVPVPRPLHELAEPEKLSDLTGVRRVRKAPRTARVAETDRHVIFAADIENLIEILVERVLISRHRHPGEDKTAAAAHNVHFPPAGLDLLDRLPVDAAVECDEINAVLSVKPHDINKVLRRQCPEVPLIMDDGVVDRNRADHRGALPTELPAERLRVAVAREVHDRLGAEIDRALHLLHLDIVIPAVAAHAEVHVDLRPEHAADSVRIKASVRLICRDDDLAACDKCTDLLRSPPLLLRYFLHFRCDDAALCGVHLCCIFHDTLLLLLLFYSRTQALLPCVIERAVPMPDVHSVPQRALDIALCRAHACLKRLSARKPRGDRR